MMAHWIFLSPHPDDVVYSCGGLIWELTARGDRIDIWTLFDADPPEGALSSYAEGLHARWNAGREAMSVRRSEDEHACKRLDVTVFHFSFPECIYRRDTSSGDWHIHGDEDLFQPLSDADGVWVNRLAERLRESLSKNTNLVSPLSMGGHIDHRLTRAAAEKIELPLWYYADYPYAARENIRMREWIGRAKVSFCLRISGPGLKAWQEASAAYRSQISTFWADQDSLFSAFDLYQKNGGGCCLWRF
jgi:LmbE family N-acetylglucosaminyl deacetylase